jgi:hypothetical protein
MTLNNLEDWLGDPRLDEYIGRRACFKIAVLAAVLSGDTTLAAVARRYGASRQAAWLHAKKAERIFGTVVKR